MRLLLKKYIEDQNGATSIEYGLIAALISVALVGGASTLGNSLTNSYEGVNNHF